MIKAALSLACLLLITPTGNCQSEKDFRIIRWKQGGCAAQAFKYDATANFMEEMPPLPVPCDTIVSNDRYYRLIHDGNITVAVTTILLDDYLVFQVTIWNDGETRILVDPLQSEVMHNDKKEETKTVVIKPIDPRKIAEKYERDARWSNALRNLGASLATKTTTVDSVTTGSVMGTGGSAIYTESGTATITERDSGKRQQAARENARDTASAQAEGDMYLQTALRANTVFPSEKLSGNLYFKYPDRKIQTLAFTITIEGTDYMYKFSYGKPKQ